MSKISSNNLRTILEMHLGGTNIYEQVLSNVKFDSDENGMVSSHAIDNLKALLQFGIKANAWKNVDITDKFVLVLEELLDYGTAESSMRARDFLAPRQDFEERIVFQGPNTCLTLTFDAKKQKSNISSVEHILNRRDDFFQ